MNERDVENMVEQLINNLMGGPEIQMRAAMQSMARLMQADEHLGNRVQGNMGELIYLSHKASECGVPFSDSSWAESVVEIRDSIHKALEDSHTRTEGEPTDSMKGFLKDMAGYWMVTCNTACLARQLHDLKAIRRHLSLTLDLRG